MTMSADVACGHAAKPLRLALGAMLLGQLMITNVHADAQTATAALSVTPVPVRPEFGSLMTDKVEARASPAADGKVLVIYKRAGQPVQLFERVGQWRRVQDQEGTDGWVRADLISRRRTALAIAARAGDQVAVRAAEQADADAVALLEAGVLVGLLACDGRYCKVTASGLRGYVLQNQLWGAAAGEIFK